MSENGAKKITVILATESDSVGCQTAGFGQCRVGRGMAKRTPPAPLVVGIPGVAPALLVQGMKPTSQF
jgi:hypothetical protein